MNMVTSNLFWLTLSKMSIFNCIWDVETTNQKKAWDLHATDRG